MRKEDDCLHFLCKDGWMDVGRFEIVIRARSPGPYFGIYRKPIWHFRIQRFSNVVVKEAGLADVFPIHIFALKSSPPMGAQSAFRW